MIIPRWIAVSSLLACALVPISVLSYPVPSVGGVAQLDDTTRLLEVFRRAPQAKRKRPKSASPVAGPSNHLPLAQHQTPNPQTPSPDGSPRRGPMDFNPSPHAPTRFKNMKSISNQASNIRSGTLKEAKYAEKTKEADKNTDWDAGKYDADHILEAQTVASKINKHKGSVNIKKACMEAIRTPLNEVSNLAPLHHNLNSKKNAIIAAIARHDKYNHAFGPGRKADGNKVKPSRKKGKKAPNPTSKEKLHPIPDFTHGVKKHILDHQVQMMETAKKVDAAIASDHCKELHGTKLKTENGKVTAQARIIIAHAKKSAGLPDHDLD